MAPNRQQGFTIIETIAAMVILTLTVPPMLWAIRDARVQRVDPVLASRARWLAVEKLEDVIADRHSTTRGYDYLVAGNYPVENNVAGFAAYSRSVTLAETLADLATAGDGYMSVDVAVSWVDTKGTTRTLTVSTVLTEYTP